jgi:NAD(P)H dehydrogenase (quinone)
VAPGARAADRRARGAAAPGDRGGEAIIGVSGASGFVGSHVAARLAERGLAQRLIVRDAARAPSLANAEVAVASRYGAGDEMRAALEGVETLFLVPAEESADRLEQHFTAVDAAVAAGVTRIVYLSFVNATEDATFTLVRHHWATEQRVRESGLAFAFERMSLYLDFIPLLAGEDGVIRGPAGAGAVAPVARADVADVAAAILADPAAHDGQTYDVTGGERFTLAEAAARLGVEYVDESIEEAYASRAAYGAPDWQVEAWVTTYEAIARGELDVLSDTVERLAGHPPRTLEDFVA